VSLEFGAVSMRFSAADAMVAWVWMCSGDEEVLPDLRSEFVVVVVVCPKHRWEAGNSSSVSAWRDH